MPVLTPPLLRARNQYIGNWLSSVFADCRFASRQLHRSPGFTVVAILTLALGIGANTTIFSLLDPLLLRKLPVQRPDELVWVNSTGTLGPAEISELQTFFIYRDKASVFTSVLAFSRLAPYAVTANGRTTVAQGLLVSGGYFNALGLRPFSGRLFTENHERNHATVVLSFNFWKHEFHSDPRAVGEIIQFGDQVDATRTGSLPQRSYIIVGIAPPEFFGTQVGEAPDFYMPLGATDLPSQDYWQTQGVSILGRLKPGISFAQAQANLDPLLQTAERVSAIPEIEQRESFARTLLTPAARGLSSIRAKYSRAARILQGLVGLLLLIACGNLANLLLARGISRRREIVVRLALGAGRPRVVRQLLTESVLLTTTGTFVASATSYWLSPVLLASLATTQFPIALPTGRNWRLLLFAALLMALTVLICGLAPALSVTRSKLADDLKSQGSAASHSSRHSRLSKVLVVAQVALSMVLVASAGLLLRSLINLETFNPGFARDQVLLVSLDGYSASHSRHQVATFYSQLLAQVRQLPGIRSASYSSFTPISGKQAGVNVIVEGYSLKPGETANERFVGVSPDYFATMDIPLLAGRDFSEQDIHLESSFYQATDVAILNRTMAHRFFGASNPIGKHLRFVEGVNNRSLEIIGIVADSKYNDLRESPLEFFYIPGTHGDLEVRANIPIEALRNSIRDIVQALDPSVGVTSVKTLRASLDESLHPDRLIAALTTTFGLLALALACIGLYGLLAFEVARRTGEMGIRTALGARPRDIFRLVVGQGLRLAAAGIVSGIFGAVAAGCLFANLLFGVKHTDALTFLVVSTTLCAAAFLACYIPARRATRVDPMIALRDE